MKKQTKLRIALSAIAVVPCYFFLVAQTFFNVSENFTAGLPSNWALGTESFIASVAVSTGYPGASGGNNLTSRNCTPSMQARGWSVTDLDASDFENITVQFGHRRTSCFEPLITFEWSSDGFTWNPISAYSSNDVSTTWLLAGPFSLPNTANDMPDLSFRWTFTTINNDTDCNVGFNTCGNGSGNYRIDDFLVTGSVVLPVELTSFLPKTVDKGVKLAWQTATERDNSHFKIEQSSDGQNFREIGVVKGNGTSQVTSNYSFLDENPATGHNYYRLQQTDFNGDTQYSEVVTAVYGAAVATKYFPNPAQSEITFVFQKPTVDDGSLEVFDVNGQLVESNLIVAGTESFDLPLGFYRPGHYFAKLLFGNSIENIRFLKK